MTIDEKVISALKELDYTKTKVTVTRKIRVNSFEELANFPEFEISIKNSWKLTKWVLYILTKTVNKIRQKYGN